MQNDTFPSMTPGQAPWSPVEPVATKPRRRFPVKLVAGGVVLLLLVIGSVVGYVTYQTPDRVISDGIDHLLNAPQLATQGAIAAEDKDFKVSVSFDKQANHASGATLTGKASFQLKAGTGAGKTYDISLRTVARAGGDDQFKLEGLTAAAHDFIDLYITNYASLGFSDPDGDDVTNAGALDDYKGDLLKLVDQLTAQLDGKWVGISAKSESRERCQIDVYNSLSSSTISHELLDQYAKHQFVSLKSQTTKDGNFDYVMNYDTLVAQDFDAAVQGTQFGKQLAACDDKPGIVNLSVDGAGFGALQDTTIEVVTSQWSHNIQMVHIKGNLIAGITAMAIDATFHFSYAAAPAPTMATSSSIDDIEVTTDPLELSIVPGD